MFGKEDYIPVENAFEEFASKLAHKVRDRVLEQKKPDTLRMSNVGSKCLRQLWFKINHPELIEKLPPEARMKFLYGDLIEELLLFLAKEAGHTVTGEQDDLNLFGVPGHRDAIIDGMVVDVKSASTFSFKKFVSGLRKEDDAFGYLPQLGGYLEASQKDEKVTFKDRAAFLVIDKTTGKIHLDEHSFVFIGTSDKIDRTRQAIARIEPPKRAYLPEPEGKSGNQKLGIECSYCPVKFACYPRLRAFAYSYGPVFLTDVVREPNVPEIT